MRLLGKGGAVHGTRGRSRWRDNWHYCHAGPYGRTVGQCQCHDMVVLTVLRPCMALCSVEAVTSRRDDARSSSTHCAGALGSDCSGCTWRTGRHLRLGEEAQQVLSAGSWAVGYPVIAAPRG